jgi:hypothetical protein
MYEEAEEYRDHLDALAQLGGLLVLRISSDQLGFSSRYCSVTFNLT